MTLPYEPEEAVVMDDLQRGRSVRDLGRDALINVSLPTASQEMQYLPCSGLIV